MADIVRSLAAIAAACALALGVSACVEEEGVSDGAGSETTSQDADKRKSKSGKRSSPEDKEPELTSGQRNALEAAQNYVDIMAFSKAGLIRQLSSSAGDGYSRREAKFAANHVDVDWKEEAVEAARNYLDTMPMSEQQLFEQLTSSAGDGFTDAQARYAVKKVY